ncbi:glycosyltransferase [Luteolibacter yonseiensis]|uniref:Glycosyltransferase n=1 Tax=Luteolibacter yonseiensis TaxID=1144680 RepID=A0A934V9Q5_9BACT|nr:glycosyltransferase [Luteolibacter yonseiensis]MBK1814400.1 glycosyltransferase [Luteolibacter yonseiensis]
MTPLVSIIMPVWNGERYLEEAVRSILGQTFRDFEFIILDDGSSDRTPEILAGFASLDSRIRVITLEHEGIVIALNRGVAESRARWIARMDADDVSHPERLARQWAAVGKNPRAVICHTHVTIFGDPAYVTKAGRFIRSQALIALRLCFQCPIIHPTVMFRKDAFLECGGYRPEERHAEDFALWGRMIEHGRIIGVPEPSLDFRVHSSSISKQQAATQEALSQKISANHCERFMNLDGENAVRAYRAIQVTFVTHPIREWLWFVVGCLPKMRWHSLEMWAWVATRSIQILRSRKNPS